MRRILVLTVGSSHVPVVRAIQENRPAFVYFLCSGGASPKASEQTITGEVRSPLSSAICPRCGTTFTPTVVSGPVATKAGLSPESFSVECVEDPDDLDQVTAACERIDQDLAQRFGDEPLEVIANYSGGTKTMTLGLGLFAHFTEGRWSLQVNSAQRRDLVQVRIGDRATRQMAEGLRIREARERAEALARRHDYDGALTILASAIRDLGPAAAAGLGSAHRSFLARAAWDRFDYEEAFEIVRSDPVLEDRFTGQLRRVLRVRDLALTEGEWHAYDVSGAALVEDLLDNAEHRAGRGRFDDAVARLYRATELVAQIRLLRAYGLSTSHAEAARGRFGSEVDAWLAELQGSGGKDGADGLALGLMQAWELLARIGDPLGVRLRAAEGKLKRWIGVRNQSLLAHGLQPVGEEGWRELGQVWADWIRQATGDLAAPAVSPLQS